MEPHRARRWTSYGERFSKDIELPDRAKDRAHRMGIVFAGAVMDAVQETFGVAGIRQLPESFCTEVFQNAEAMYLSAWRDSRTESLIEAGFESQRRMDRMVLATIEGIGNGEGEIGVHARMMAAAIDVPDPTKDTDVDLCDETGDEPEEEIRP